MKRISRLIGRHLAGDAEPVLSLPTLGGTIHLQRTDETLTAYGGLVAYSAFVKKLGWLADLAARFPSPRTSPNALPVSAVLHGFTLNCLCAGCRFAHVRCVQGDPAVAQVMGMHRVPGEDALPRLVKALPRAQARQWLQGTEQELYAALPREFVADWDATVNVRYGHQEDTAVAVSKAWWGRLRTGYERLSEWLKITAPQLDLQGDLSRYWSPQPLFSPGEWFKTLTPNCGI